MAEVRIRLTGINQLVKDLPKFSNDIEKQVAEKAPDEIIKNIKRGKTGIFPANPLPFNKPSTIARKGHGRQLQDKGILIDETKWSVGKSSKGHVVKPPSERGEIVAHLNSPTSNRPAYKILDIPVGFYPDWARSLVNKAFSIFIKKYA